ncbi:EamA family transporter [Amylibacter sp. SFDW26]|nr:EamA family transporter [Amylibacter sp. SFDW26]
MNRTMNILITSLAPMIWGSSYIVTTQMLPNLDPITISVLRALPAGLLLLVLVRQFPKGMWIFKMLVLGALNFAIFWALLFYSAYRLPGGVAAVLGALQPLVVIFAAYGLLGTSIRPLSMLAVLFGVLGIALLILTPDAKLDMWGVVAGFIGASSMAFGVVLSRKWQPPVSALTFTAWQLTAGGVLLVPLTTFTTTDWSTITGINILGLSYLGLIGAAATYAIWLRGIKLLQPSAVSILALLSPVSATLLGWFILDETLSGLQLCGMCVVLCSVMLGQYALRARPETV